MQFTSPQRTGKFHLKLPLKIFLPTRSHIFESSFRKILVEGSAISQCLFFFAKTKKEKKRISNDTMRTSWNRRKIEEIENKRESWKFSSRKVSVSGEQIRVVPFERCKLKVSLEFLSPATRKRCEPETFHAKL